MVKAKKLEVESVPRINNRATDDLEDVLDVDIPLVRRSVDLIEGLRNHEITPAQFQEAVKLMQEDLDLLHTLTPFIEQSIEQKDDVVIYRRTGKTHREGIQLFYLDANVLHPPHCHHNILSTQLMLRGRCHAREFNRIARIDDETLLLQLTSDGWIGPGEALRTTEISNNCHWFGSGAEPAIMLNFNAYGYQDWTFNPKDRPLRRNLVDPTAGRNRDGLFLAKEITVEAAYEKFGCRPLSDFPMD